MKRFWPEIKCVVKDGGLSDGYQITALHYYGFIRKDSEQFHFLMKGRIRKRGFHISYSKPQHQLYSWRNKIKQKNTIYFWRFRFGWGEL